ncbi:Cytoplasmic dynein 2 light intermediate chain 1 [Taenia solium]
MAQPLWDLVIKQSRLKSESTRRAASSLVFAGCESSGKSTLINNFLEKNEVPRKTLALEFNFCRRNRGPCFPKTVVHLWELGGGVKFSDLLGVIVTKNSVELCIVIVLDLSKPTEFWAHLTRLISSLESSINNALEQRRSQANGGSRKVESNRICRMLNADHPDRGLMAIFPVPLTIIGSKYDIFLNLNLERRDFITKSLRFVAHFYGAALFFTNAVDTSMTKEIRDYLNYLAFDTSIPVTSPTLEGGPLHILPGQDSFDSIGLPPSESYLKQSDESTPFQLWERAFIRRFPQVPISTSANDSDPGADEQFAEPEVDAVRQLKDEEFERSRRQSERFMQVRMQPTSVDETVFGA